MRKHGSKKVNARIAARMEKCLERAADEPHYAQRRLRKLDREWDIDRAILVPFATAGAVALALGLRKNPRWRFPLTAQVAFMLAYATVGWCPPAAILRRLGFRTRQEIDAERLALIGHLAR